MLDSPADQSCIWVLALGVVASPPCAELCREGPRGRATGLRGPRVRLKGAAVSCFAALCWLLTFQSSVRRLICSSLTRQKAVALVTNPWGLEASPTLTVRGSGGQEATNPVLTSLQPFTSHAKLGSAGQGVVYTRSL